MKKLFVGIAVVSGLAFAGCNDSFLDKTPITDLTEDNAFNSYDNFKNFMWPCYEMFVNTTIRTSTRDNGWGTGGQYEGDVDAVLISLLIRQKEVRLLVMDGISALTFVG